MFHRYFILSSIIYIFAATAIGCGAPVVYGYTGAKLKKENVAIIYNYLVGEEAGFKSNSFTDERNAFFTIVGVDGRSILVNRGEILHLAAGKHVLTLKTLKMKSPTQNESFEMTVNVSAGQMYVLMLGEIEPSCFGNPTWTAGVYPVDEEPSMDAIGYYASSSPAGALRYQCNVIEGSELQADLEKQLSDLTMAMKWSLASDEKMQQNCSCHLAD
ncbi:MAG: hypothetical protein JXX29_13860 [Deltaproteobacteria bacterium]|nr:hypothetical protein [Deltaproteobacteria bacterium]MBN2672762.1 hypothetical protein [Deltaproteobacteria bacterium]